MRHAVNESSYMFTNFANQHLTSNLTSRENALCMCTSNKTQNVNLKTSEFGSKLSKCENIWT